MGVKVKALAEILESESFEEHVLLDGGMGTALIAAGLDVQKESTAAWNLSHGQEVLAVHKGFVKAGVSAIQTNTFTANRMSLAYYNLDTVRECNLAGVALAKEAAQGSQTLVVGSMGPTGKRADSVLTMSRAQWQEVFCEQAGFLAEGGVDFLHLETVTNVEEAQIALRGIQAGAPQLPVVISFTCQAPEQGFQTIAGEPMEAMLKVAKEEGADGIGLNCMLTPAQMVPLIQRIKNQVEVPVFAKPTPSPDGVRLLSSDEFKMGLKHLWEAGAHAVGGCCGTLAQDLVLPKNTGDRE